MSMDIDWRASYEALSKQNDTFRQRIAALQQRVAELEREKRELGEALYAVGRFKDDLNSKLASAEFDVQKLEQELQQSRERETRLRSAANGVITDLCTGEVTLRRPSLEHLKAALSAKDSQ